MAGIWLSCRPGRSAPRPSAAKRQRALAKGGCAVKVLGRNASRIQKHQHFPPFPAVAARFEISFDCCPLPSTSHSSQTSLGTLSSTMQHQSKTHKPRSRCGRHWSQRFPKMSYWRAACKLRQSPQFLVSAVSPKSHDPWSPAESDTRESPRGNQKVCRPPGLQQHLARLVHTTHFPQNSTMPIAKSRHPDLVPR